MKWLLRMQKHANEALDDTLESSGSSPDCDFDYGRQGSSCHAPTGFETGRTYEMQV